MLGVMNSKQTKAPYLSMNFAILCHDPVCGRSGGVKDNEKVGDQTLIHVDDLHCDTGVVGDDHHLRDGPRKECKEESALAANSLANSLNPSVSPMVMRWWDDQNSSSRSVVIVRGRPMCAQVNGARNEQKTSVRKEKKNTQLDI